MTTPQLSTRILMTKIKKIENKQAERYPLLLERLDRIEQSIVALVNRLNESNRAISILENKQNADMYNLQYPERRKNKCPKIL